MRKIYIPIMSTIFLAAAAANLANADEKVIDKPVFKSAGGIFDIDALEALGRVSAPRLSPDKEKILYGISYESVEQNSSNCDLYVMNLDGSDNRRITRSEKSESNPAWFDGGSRILFLYPEKDKNQLWVMNADGSDRKRISDLEKGIDGFLLSPDEKHLVFISSVKYTRTPQELFPDLPKATGKVIDDLMYKHWDEWVTDIPHPFLARFDGDSISDIADLMQDEPYECPMKPFGGIESFAWSPDSRQLIYVSRKKKGMEYALSTNSDLYLYDLDSKETLNLTQGMTGYDTNPAFSPDGKYLAWLSMEHDGYESDKNRLFMLERKTGEKIDLTAEWDYTIDEFAWESDSKSICFIAPYQGTAPIFRIKIESKEISVLSEGVCDYHSLCPAGKERLIALRHSMLAPDEICLVEGNEARQISFVNKEIFDQLKMPTVEKRFVTTTDDRQMLTWVIYPPDFDKSSKYPAILYCQGGPQQALSQIWSYRWNFALMASCGYVVIAPNRRGLPGFGTEWNAQISGDYGGQNMKDYLSAVDDLKNEPYIDAARIGAAGASYGGFSVYWLAGNHDKRFACLFAHAGIFNTETQYLETEEMWFANWDMGGPFWDKANPVAQRTFAESPHKYVDRWDTPIMISHGEKDYRILASQGMQAFNAAKLRGIPAQMVIFPDENHWIQKPQNAIMWQRLFFDWFDRWLKPDDK